MHIEHFQKRLVARTIFAFCIFAACVSSPIFYGALTRGWIGALAGLGAALLLARGIRAIAEFQNRLHEQRAKKKKEKAAKVLHESKATLLSLRLHPKPERVQTTDEDESENNLTDFFPKQFLLRFQFPPPRDFAWKVAGIEIETDFDADLLNDGEDSVTLGKEVLPIEILVKNSQGLFVRAKGGFLGEQELEMNFAVGKNVHAIDITYYGVPILHCALSEL